MWRISCSETCNTLPSKDLQENSLSNYYIISLGKGKKPFVLKYGYMVCSHSVPQRLLSSSSFQFTAPSAAASAARPTPVEKRARQIVGGGNTINTTDNRFQKASICSDLWLECQKCEKFQNLKSYATYLDNNRIATRECGWVGIRGDTMGGDVAVRQSD